jgi:CHAT domain-containing protein/uncharacterized protein HemY
MRTRIFSILRAMHSDPINVSTFIFCVFSLMSLQAGAQVLNYSQQAELRFHKLAGSAVGPLAAKQPQEKSVEQTLELTKQIVREIAGKQSHSYQVTVKQGEFVCVQVKEESAYVSLTLFEANNTKLLEVSHPLRQKEIIWVTKTDAKLRVEVHTRYNDSLLGKYQIGITERRVATDKDQQRFSAQQTLYEGVRQFGQRSEEAQQKAAILFEEAAILWSQVKDGHNEANARMYLGATLLGLKHWQSAIKEIEKAAAYWQAQADAAGQVQAQHELGEAFSALGDQARALKCYEEALALLNTVYDPEAEAHLTDHVLTYYHERGETQKVLGYLDRFLKAAKSANRPRRENASLNRVGSIYYQLGENYKALDYLDRSLKLSQTILDKFREAEARFLMGQVYDRLGRKRRALDSSVQSLAISREIKNPRLEAAAHSHIAMVNQYLGDGQQALDSLNQMIRIYQTLGDKAREAAAHVMLGYTFAVLGDRQQALAKIEQAEKIGLSERDASGFSNIGEAYFGLNEPKKALEYLNRSLKLIFTKKRRSEDDARIFDNLGNAYTALGEKQKALEYFEQALKIIHGLGDRDFEAEVLAHTANAYAVLGERQKALAYYERALPILHTSENRVGEARVFGKLMSFWQNTNNKLASLYGKQSVNLFQQLRADNQGLDRSLHQTFLKSIEDVYRTLSDLLIAQGRLPEAERVLEMLKEEEYFKYLRRDREVASALKLRADLTESEVKALEEYTRLADHLAAISSELDQLELARLQAPENKAFPQQARYDQLKTQLAAAIETFGVFNRQLAAEFGKANVRVKEIESGLQADLKTWQAKDAIIISTIAGEERLHLIVTTPNLQIPHTVKIKDTELNRLVSEFRSAVTNPCACVDPRPAGQKIYELLIKPLEQDLKGAQAKTLLWSLDGALRYVPLSALWDGKQYLAERFNLVVLTLASRSKLAVMPQAVAQWRGLGVGVSQGWAGFSPLPAVPDELRAIIREEGVPSVGRAEFGVVPGRRLLDSDFTRVALEHALGRYSLIHIASHFSFEAGREGGSFLLLGDGSRYTLDDVKNTTPLFTGVELLTLSACNTAVGGERNGEEVEGLGMLAQRQGALAVVASLWAVADDSTAVLMRDFYRRRISGGKLTKAEALRAAQLALLRGELKHSGSKEVRSEIAGAAVKEQSAFKPDPNAPYAHPYFWAPFILIGNWH